MDLALQRGDNASGEHLLERRKTQKSFVKFYIFMALFVPFLLTVLVSIGLNVCQYPFGRYSLTYQISDMVPFLFSCFMLKLAYSKASSCMKLLDIGRTVRGALLYIFFFSPSVR